MKHDDEAHKYYYPVEGRTDGAIGDAIALIAIILVPAGIYAAWNTVASWISALFS
ncbi:MULTISPECIES: hypothetical protein [unclassified Mesorhizobium]|uniref:hypothetical protein n=1 Tax=unclassified Mesorhizobium TaxID=325217 RepID=UPI00241595EE|nr:MULTISPECIES: hypothetical protein [unclassified Mesorhizobium]MDG4890055.1 hypothetical protein [Mesorhizobium sp. WSM4887]MDG4904197.1 hypothetical protein [Mesorhizobium sp. WSM4962]MDG4909224.1 hypothetical protein [Mesorhizobium sp. WSM4898]MDG4921848.1 hypothetical protein [Mesorhizobium sp. WSM4989]